MYDEPHAYPSHGIPLFISQPTQKDLRSGRCIFPSCLNWSASNLQLHIAPIAINLWALDRECQLYYGKTI